MNFIIELVKAMVSILKVVLLFLTPLWLFIMMMFSVISFRLLYEVKVNKRRLPLKGEYKKPSFFKRMFVMFPKQLAEDVFSKEDYEFDEYGIHMICGEQGAGKTTCVVYLLQKWKALYPYMKIATNMGYKFEDDQLTDHKGIVGRNNGKLGQVEVIDEIQTWFSSLNSKDFPVEMLAELSQQRKQRKCIVGTAQVFSRMAKPLREQTHFVYLPMTFFGCLTVVRKSHVKHWSDEKQRFKKYTGFFFFVHNPDIRKSFDTYLRIEDYKKKGFKSDIERMVSNQTG